MLTPVLSLCLLLTPHEISQSPVDALTVSQLEYEDWRLGSPPALGGWISMLAAGVPLAAGGGALTYFAIDATRHANGWDVLGWWIIDAALVCVTVIGALLTVGGSVMTPITLWRRSKWSARHSDVRSRLHDIRTGAVAMPEEPDLEGARAELKLTQLLERRPGLGLPIGLMAGGLGAIAYGTYQALLLNGQPASRYSDISLGIAVGMIVAGVVMEGLGTTQLITRLQERKEIDAELRALERGDDVAPRPPPPPPSAGSKLPPAPVFFTYAWEL